MQTNIMIKTRDKLKSTWQLLFPKVAPPSDEQWTLWLMLHDQKTVTVGIMALAQKYQRLGGRMDYAYMTRFASSVMSRVKGESHSGGVC